ncbi:purine/pyrimidine permease [Desulfobotulus sp. H1]|uniref:Purine/pyrimidine permease n=1 Tax=Desulfobotulus pelophilus TaxID=2823377 RepID=A0ABT3N7F2_9BACT|nr:solute carrier family 23 protein [Desulfobotulus pelophilus]MCW7753384.1 purine/pyrimidine permease [Desulfobotulus pelophilus]
MEKQAMQYGLDEWPPPARMLVFGLQWLAVTIVTVIIIGKVVAGLQYSDPGQQLLYMQKLFFVMGAALLFQILWGHRMPLITGPATVLLVAILAGSDSSVDAIYTSIAAGGAFLVLLSITGLFSRMAGLFTPRVVAAILILIALTITPTILNLLLMGASQENILTHLGFALIFFVTMVLADRLLPGIWKSTMMVWAIVGGSFLCLLLLPPDNWRRAGDAGVVAPFFSGFTTSPVWEPGLLISFVICFIALSINDLGSIRALGQIIRPPAMERRVSAGITLSGFANMVAGFFGVIGPVNFSMSVGIVAANGNASRFTMIPTSMGMMTMAFFPAVVAFTWNVPALVVGTLLLYIMCAQMAAGLMVAFGNGEFSFQDGLTLGIPMMLGILVSYMPPEVRVALPPLLVPILGNGFVVGVFAALSLEHIVFRRSRREKAEEEVLSQH